MTARTRFFFILGFLLLFFLYAFYSTVSVSTEVKTHNPLLVVDVHENTRELEEEEEEEEVITTRKLKKKKGKKKKGSLEVVTTTGKVETTNVVKNTNAVIGVTTAGTLLPSASVSVKNDTVGTNFVTNKVVTTNQSSDMTDSIKHLEVAFVILSDKNPISAAHRRSARETWLSPLVKQHSHYMVDSSGKSINVPMVHFFTIGINDATNEELNALRAENDVFGDLLLMPLSDKYAGGGMLLKFMMALQIITVDKNIRVKYFFRATHDCFVHLPNALRAAKTTKAEKVYWGYIFRNSPILRDPNHKNGDMKYDVCEKFFNPYMSGASFAISQDIATWLIGAFPFSKDPTAIFSKIDSILPGKKFSRNLEVLQIAPKFFVNDDVNFGLIMTILDIEWRHDTNFMPFDPASAFISDIKAQYKYYKDVSNSNQQHDYFRTYKHQIMDAMGLPNDNVAFKDTCVTSADKFFCEKKNILAMHVHLTGDHLESLSFRFLGGCRCT